MNILCIGDVVGSQSCAFLRERLPSFKKLKGVDLVVANCENSADGNGTTPASAEYLFQSGVDILTGGNHTFRRREFYDLLEESPSILRPANLPDSAPGRGYFLCDMGRVQVAVLNLMGTVFMESLRCPFETADAILKGITETKIILVDFHAEATAEKKALGYYLDGRISALFGTHTHVQTSDEMILPKGTGYITDVGMTGPIFSALGVKPELAIAKMKGKLPVRFELAQGENMMNCVLFQIDDRTGKTLGIERFDVR